MQPGQHVRYAVLIPAYRPSAGLIDLVRDLAGRGMPAIVVVDDGSGAEFRGIFDQVAQLPSVQVLRHAVNLGKGAALKTGINHALCEFPELRGVVTADADGQHHPEDIERVAARLHGASRRAGAGRAAPSMAPCRCAAASATSSRAGSCRR